MHQNDLILLRKIKIINIANMQFATLRLTYKGCT